MFPNGLVFINGRECTDSSHVLREEDIVSVRGKGKFRYAQETGMSKKGKTNCRILIYK
jgi:RNA-binding protein YlmH